MPPVLACGILDGRHPPSRSVPRHGLDRSSHHAHWHARLSHQDPPAWAAPRSATFPDRHAAQAWAQHTEATAPAGPPGSAASAPAYPGRDHRSVRAGGPPAQELCLGNHADPATPVVAQTGGERLLAELTLALVGQYREQLARGDHGTPRAPATVNRYLAALSHVCTTATPEWEWLERNPLQKARKLRDPVAASASRAMRNALGSWRPSRPVRSISVPGGGARTLHRGPQDGDPHADLAGGRSAAWADHPP
jgi:hypothetical protein